MQKQNFNVDNVIFLFILTLTINSFYIHFWTFRSQSQLHYIGNANLDNIGLNIQIALQYYQHDVTFNMLLLCSKWYCHCDFGTYWQKIKLLIWHSGSRDDGCEHCKDVHPYCNETIGSCYHLSAAYMNVAAGITYCEEKGLYLVSVDSLEEFYYLRGVISECKQRLNHRTTSD